MCETGKEVDKHCPIADGPCPGHCVFANIMRSVSLGILVLDLERRETLFANASVRQSLAMAGISPDHETLRALFVPEAPWRAEAELARDTLRAGNHLLGYTTYGARGYAWIFLRDITEKARLEAIAESVETMSNIGYVFSAVRHELGNPINSVKAALSVLRRDLSRLPPERVADYIDRISGEVGRVENLLQSLKSFSMYERPDIRPTDLASVVREFSSLAVEEVRQHGVSVEVIAPEPCWAACDPRVLQQVFLNLFANAADALTDRPDPKIRIFAESVGNLVYVRFVDNGAGMSPSEIEMAFKPFHTSKERGTGLGLVICRKMLTRVGATIGIHSQEGQGTEVTISLSACPPPA